MKIRREHRVNVSPEDVPEAWPDVKMDYSELVIRPSLVRVVFDQDHDGPAIVYSIVACGLRVLKSGKTGVTSHEKRYWSYDAKPDWVMRAVECARKAAGL